MAGMMASATVGYTMRASTFFTSRSSMSASCFSGFSSALVMYVFTISGCFATSALKFATRNCRHESPMPALLKPMTMFDFLGPAFSPEPVANAATTSPTMSRTARDRRMKRFIPFLLLQHFSHAR